MTKDRLNNAEKAAKEEMREAMQTMYDALNQGQQKKLVENEKVKKLFDRYGAEHI